MLDFTQTFCGALPSECAPFIGDKNFGYRALSGEERDNIITEILCRLDADRQKVASPHRRDVWEIGWRETYEEYIGSDYDPQTLVPKFIRPGQVLRSRQQFIVPEDRQFELNYVQALQQWLFRAYFFEVDEIHEFGCGTGINLVALAKMFPEKQLHGSDFVPSSVELVKAIAKRIDAKLRGRLFDMKAPPDDYRISGNAGVLTFGSIEQLASDFHPFIKFLLAAKPAICLHVEPVIELYDDYNMVDYLAIRFHRQRGYTIGFLPALQLLEKHKQIELISARRLFFGSMMMEGYNVIAWKPK